MLLTSCSLCYSVSYDDQELILQWYHKNPVTVSDKIQIPSYTLTSYDHYSDTEDFSTGTILYFDVRKLSRTLLQPF